MNFHSYPMTRQAIDLTVYGLIFDSRASMESVDVFRLS